MSEQRDTTIVRAAIYPAIGIARVGNSETEFYLAPEVPDPPRQEPGFYRDATGALKRQAPRFRVYKSGCRRAGRGRADREQCRNTLERAPRQQEGRLVSIPTCSGHSGGCLCATVLAEEHHDRRSTATDD